MGWEGLRSGSASQLRAFDVARDYAAPAGAKGSVGGQHVPDRLGESAGQVDLGDLGAALAAQPGLGAPVALGVDRMTAGVGSRLDQRPAQILRSVLAERAAVVLAAGLVDPRTQPGVPGQLGRAGEAGDVADLGGDGVAEHPADSRSGHQQRDVPMIGAQLP